jgi:hypothetical protein
MSNQTGNSSSEAVSGPLPGLPTGLDGTLTNKISPQIPHMGWEAVFEEAFGLSVDEFYIEFDTVFDQPGGHMEILHLG